LFLVLGAIVIIVSVGVNCESANRNCESQISES
jgi:hypothetical protein